MSYNEEDTNGDGVSDRRWSETFEYGEDGSSTVTSRYDENNDGVAEIFTYSQAFEGAGFTVYQRNEGTWEQAVETSNYHCGY